MKSANRVRFSKKNLGVLSPLENDVINELWKCDKGCRVRDVHKKISRNKDVALTSIAVILDRLHEKKFVKRCTRKGRGGEHYLYCCTCDRKNYQESVVEKTVDMLIKNFGDVAEDYLSTRFGKKRSE